MDSLFIIRVITSFVVGGLFISLQTIIAERVASRWRGIILTIPSTSAVGFFFIGLTKTPSDIQGAALVFPASLAACYIFIMIFALLARGRMWLAFLVSYGVWVLNAALIMRFPPESFLTSIALYALPITIAAYAITRSATTTTAFTPVPFSYTHLFLRALLSGTVVSIIVILANTLGNGWGGLFAGFPAAFSATFLIYYITYGKHVLPSIARTLFFPGSIGFIIYALCMSIASPIYGLWVGTALGYAVTICFYILFATIKEKILITSPIRPR